ncbi:hypothetical protein K438DRAFT_1940337 [Mycena galopus ATCC 62051]|nr:hypothetical protein K438DRAFT_1940337 [Mycena galopus ATCC 62051]
MAANRARVNLISYVADQLRIEQCWVILPAANLDAVDLCKGIYIFACVGCVIRAKSVHSNRHALSRDIAHAFAQGNRIRHLLSGGLFLLAQSDPIPSSSTSAIQPEQPVTTVPRPFSDAIDAWHTIGPGPKYLVDSLSTVTSYLRLDNKKTPASGVCFLDKIQARPIGEMLIGTHIADWSTRQGLFRTCKDIILPNGDLCTAGSFVIVRHPELIGETFVAQVEEIVQQVGSVAAHASLADGILAQKVLLIQGLSRYGMPTVFLTNE